MRWAAHSRSFTEMGKVKMLPISTNSSKPATSTSNNNIIYSIPSLEARKELNRCLRWVMVLVMRSIT